MDFYSLKAVLVVFCLTVCVEFAHPSIQTVLYRIEVVTSDEWGAGTDANVHIKIYGSLGNTDSIKLTKGGNLFEKGAHDEFVFVAKYVGNPITKVEVMRDTKGLFDDWKLDKILVKSNAPIVYKFAFNAWIPPNKWIKSYGGK
ncbi:lipoxygenase homology domain-containing protein 1-like [Actinia tenebrosa]|uniref:Lipoxygenase homology domain-containing protein 1-like n=1 Tax=Actinia tenebrosa TaxID=6105 RepID=A0A6P8HEM2_ACTTE|nr:lipoxygenase homology domain-containing protein 1-like [Actinia tenebrosa]